MKLQPLPAALLLGAGLLLLAPATGPGQVQPYGAPAADLNGVARELAGRVRHLGEEIASTMGREPSSRHLLEDTREMAVAVDEFRESLRGAIDPNRAGQAFAGIDQTWLHLRGQLTRPGFSPDPVNRAIARVDELMAAIRQGVGINPPPPGYDAAGPAPSGVADTRRLAHALVGRAQGLLAAIQVHMANDPNRAAFANDANQLIQVADRFHDSIDANQPIAVVAQAFAPADQLTDRMEQFVNTGRVPPQVRQAWQGVAAVESLIRRDLGLGASQPGVPDVFNPAPGGGPSPLAALAAQLVDQANTYVATFSTTARHEPEGLAALADAQRLRDAALDFQQDVARNLPPNQVAFEFRDVDANWQRLFRRASRIARGRNGPYIQQVQGIGATTEQIHQALGMIGTTPTFPGSSPNFPPPPGSGLYR